MDATNIIVKQSIVDAEKKVQDLYETKDMCFTTEAKQAQANMMSDIVSLLPTNIERAVTVEKDGDDYIHKPIAADAKSKLYYIKGKALEAGPEYSKESEECLSKAVKLNPKLTDAWNCLGHCLMKKKDLESARRCFLSAFSLV